MSAKECCVNVCDDTSLSRYKSLSESLLVAESLLAAGGNPIVGKTPAEIFRPQRSRPIYIKLQSRNVGNGSRMYADGAGTYSSEHG